MTDTPRKITAEALRKMTPEAIADLPTPVMVGKKRMAWDGYQWVRLGPSDGTEPIEVTTDD